VGEGRVQKSCVVVCSKTYRLQERKGKRGEKDNKPQDNDIKLAKKKSCPPSGIKVPLLREESLRELEKKRTKVERKLFPDLRIVGERSYDGRGTGLRRKKKRLRGEVGRKNLRPSSTTT